ncbi:MAG: hypothetical protein EU529_07860 [Promethearchaeota archaeon]|nr:MAG: hypothetical protein EU529_07860 [Candidatus Lokiarchaeota archaeon]
MIDSDDDLIDALDLSQEAKRKALALYKDYYINNRFKIHSSDCIIPENRFYKVLKDCLILSQQKIEERSISTKFIFPNINKDDLEWPEGLNFTPIKEISFSSLSLTNLKKYLEMASDPNTFLVIGNVPMKNNFENDNIHEFILKGLLFVEKSLRNLKLNCEKKIKLKDDQEISKNLKSLFNSVIFNLESGIIRISYFDEMFIKIEKGMISSVPQLIIEPFFILEKSTRFNTNLNDLAGIDFSKFSQRELIKFYHKIVDKDIQDKVFHRLNIEYLITESLKNLIFKISEAKHGTILVFGFIGNPNDQNLFQPGAIKLNIPYGSSFLKIKELHSNKTLSIIEMYENAIVSLSKTDGAMIFNQDLDLILAGAFLKTVSSVTSSGGARRKSAEGFVRDNEGVAAIVISQDGGITFLPKNDIDAE